MTVFRLERIVRDEVITRGLEILEKEQRERPATGRGSANAMSFEPVLCTRATQQDRTLVDPSLTGSSKVTEGTDPHNTHEKGLWSRNLPKLIRRFTYHIPLGKSATSSKVNKVEHFDCSG